MLKKSITYKDLDGNDVSEDFYFNLTKAEIAEMQLSYEGGLTTYLTRIVAANSGREIIEACKEILSASVGRRSEDGRRFIKSKEITEDFMQTEAYSDLFMELITDAGKCVEFVKGVVPSDLGKDLETNKDILALTSHSMDENPTKINRAPDFTQEEIRNMTPEEFMARFSAKTQ